MAVIPSAKGHLEILQSQIFDVHVLHMWECLCRPYLQSTNSIIYTDLSSAYKDDSKYAYYTALYSTLCTCMRVTVVVPCGCVVY